MRSRFFFGVILWCVWITNAVECFAQQDRVPEWDTKSLPNGVAGVRNVDQSANPLNAELPNIPSFGGPNSVAGQLAEDSQVEAEPRWQDFGNLSNRWFEWKQSVNQKRGLRFGIDESLFYQVASQSLGKSDGFSGLVRCFGEWEPFHRHKLQNRGSLVFKVENRHRISAITPFELGFEAGSITPTGTFFSAFDFGVTNFFWKQYASDGKLAFAVGKIDVTDYVDVYAMLNPLTHFINLSFSTNPTIAVPNQGLGTAVGGMLTDKLYFQAGLSDANGQATRSGFDSFFDDREHFSYAEVGITSSKDRIYLDNTHLTFWHTDARQKAGTPAGWGVAFTAQKYLNESWLPFFRFGYSEGDAALLQTVISTGLGFRRRNSDVAGFGLSWGKPADGSLKDQFTSEAFYRFQLTQVLAVTPDIQLIADPALNPEEDLLAFFGIRVRAAF